MDLTSGHVHVNTLCALIMPTKALHLRVITGHSTPGLRSWTLGNMNGSAIELHMRHTWSPTYSGPAYNIFTLQQCKSN